jgi:transposase
LTSKIHVVVDEKGLPVRLSLTAGQASDKAAAPALLEGLPVSSIVIADRGYDWQHLIDLVAQRGGQAHIPTQRDRKLQRSVDPALYRQRNLVERFFCKLKHFRRIATRYDKLARNFLAAVAIASIRLWTRNYESTT